MHNDHSTEICVVGIFDGLIFHTGEIRIPTKVVKCSSLCVEYTASGVRMYAYVLSNRNLDKVTESEKSCFKYRIRQSISRTTKSTETALKGFKSNRSSKLERANINLPEAYFTGCNVYNYMDFQKVSYEEEGSVSFV